MAEVRSLVCDMCKEPNAVTYSISEKPQTPWMVDLCEDCARPIMAWKEHGRLSAARRAYRRFNKVPAVPLKSTYKGS